MADFFKTLENQAHSRIERLVGPNCENTVKPVLSGHSKIDKSKILMANGSLMKIESIAECNTFDLH